jgi:hypothetical protein
MIFKIIETNTIEKVVRYAKGRRGEKNGRKEGRICEK